MKAFFSADQLLHDPQQFMRLGRIVNPTDLPARAHALCDALASHGVMLAEPGDHGRGPLEAVHHARRDRANGFCCVNNSAIAAERLAASHRRVAIFDIDAHHGDGTQEIFYARDDILTVSVHADPSGYDPFFNGYAQEQGIGAGEGFNLNLPLPHGTGNDTFLQAADEGLRRVRVYSPGALVIPLGFDGFKDDPISVLRLELEVYRDIGQRLGALRLPTVIVQEGGYKVDAIGPALAFFLQGFLHAR